jgi:hypothetical protein
MSENKIILCIAVFALVGVGIAEARDFRKSRVIKTPHTKSAPVIKGDTKGTALKKAVNVDRKLIQQAYQSIFKAWGTPELDKMISDNFSDKKELMNAIADGIPFNANLRFISMDSMRVLTQKRVDGTKNNVSSIVSAEVTTEVTYQDSKLGFQTIRGTGEYTIELITEGHNL